MNVIIFYNIHIVQMSFDLSNHLHIHLGCLYLLQSYPTTLTSIATTTVASVPTIATTAVSMIAAKATTAVNSLSTKVTTTVASISSKVATFHLISVHAASWDIILVGQIASVHPEF